MKGRDRGGRWKSLVGAFRSRRRRSRRGRSRDRASRSARAIVPRLGRLVDSMVPLDLVVPEGEERPRFVVDRLGPTHSRAPPPPR